MPSRNVIEIVISAEDDASKALGSTDSLLGKIGQTAAIGAAAVVAAVGAIGAGMFELAREAAPIEGIEKAFDGIAKASGKSADAVIKSLADSSKGMITNTELMKSYNSAAQLVSKDFANQLPEAMQYLSKVSAATGQDMGFMLDSLVKGVGRVSPMILDNLGIQVNATQAMEEYAKANGKTADQLTKTEQQAAIMAKTLEQLKNNTAAMPDITDNASTKWAQFQTRLANFKDDLGVKLLPFFQGFISLLMKIADVVLPIIMPIIERVAGAFATFFKALGDGVDPFKALGIAIFSVFGEKSRGVAEFLQKIGEAVKDFIGWIQQGENPIKALGDALSETFSGSFLGTVGDVIYQVGGFVDSLIEGFGMVVNAAGTFIEDLQSMGLNNAIGNLLSPDEGGRGGFVTNLLMGLGLSEAAVGAFTATVFDAWRMLKTFIEGSLIPTLQKLAAWFIQDALPVVVGFITGTVIPAVQGFINILLSIWNMVSPVLFKVVDWFINTGLPLAVNFLQNTVIPYVQKFIEGIMDIWTKVQPGLQNLFDWFVTTGLPLITGFIENIAVPIIEKIIGIIGDIWTKVAPALGDLAKWFLEDVFPSILDFITNVALPVIQSIIDIFKAIWIAIQPALHDFQNGVKSVMDQVMIIVKPVKDFIDDLIKKFNDLKNLVSGGVGALGGAAQNASTAAGMVASGQVSGNDFLRALGNAIGSEFSGHALGLKNVPQDGLYKLHAGEEVKTAAETQWGGGGSQPITVNFYGGGAPSNEAEANDAAFMLVGSLQARGLNV